MKNRKKRYCTKCNTITKREPDKRIGYPYVCNYCDENLFSFETYKTKKKKIKKAM